MLQLDGLRTNSTALRFIEQQNIAEDTKGEEDSLGFCLSICDLAYEDGVLWVADVSLLVHVGGGNCEHGAIIIEGKRGDAGGIPMELTQALLVERIPDVHKAV